MLCDQVAIDQGTQKPYLLGVFSGVAADKFPTERQRFEVFTVLTDGLGDLELTLHVIHMDTDQEVYTQHLRVNFPDPLKVVNLRIKVRNLIYEVPGTYLFSLTVDDQILTDDDKELAGRRVQVYQVGESL
jgi:hypothetical protein